MAEFEDDVDEEMLLAMQLVTQKAETHHTPSKSTSMSNSIEIVDVSDDEDLLQAMQQATEKAEAHRTPPKSTVRQNRITELMDDDLLAMQQATGKVDNEHFRKSARTDNCTDFTDDEDFLLAVRLSFEDAEASQTSKSTITPPSQNLQLSNEVNSLAVKRLVFPKSVSMCEIKPPKDSTAILHDYEYARQVSNELNKNSTYEKIHKLSTSSSANTDWNDFDLDVQMLGQTDDDDYLLALQLSQVDSPKKWTKSPQKSENVIQYLDRNMSVVDPSWETIDPNPDIYALFVAFNKRFFWGKLDMVEVQWSPRMTSCAGICSYHSRAGHCTVRLSVPLLKLRPRKDLVETLLHEMIHAYLFVTKNNRDRDGHGPQFHAHMYRINKESGANITVYHTFHDEVNSYKTHWWKCDGPCQYKQPFYGYVKRSMNRAPGPHDLWWNDHRATCNGQFHKVKEPENYGQKKTKGKKTQGETTSIKNVANGILNYFKIPPSENATSSFTVPNAASSFSRGSSNQSSFSAPTSGSKKIVSLSDLSKNLNQRSPTKSPKKFVPLPGQKNIFQFVNK